MPRRELDDDEEWERIDSHPQDEDYHMIQSNRSKRNEQSVHSESTIAEGHTAALDRSAAQRRSSRSSSPQDGQTPESVHDNSMALVKRTPSTSELALVHRPRSSQDQGEQRQLTTQSISYRSHSPNPMQQPQRSRTPVDPRAWGPRHEQPQRSPGRTGHTYGTVYATGRSTVIMGNIGAIPEGARSHTYGPVFTADEAKVYFGDATTEEAAKAFKRRDEGQ